MRQYSTVCSISDSGHSYGMQGMPILSRKRGNCGTQQLSDQPSAASQQLIDIHPLILLWKQCRRDIGHAKTVDVSTESMSGVSWPESGIAGPSATAIAFFWSLSHLDACVGRHQAPIGSGAQGVGKLGKGLR